MTKKSFTQIDTALSCGHDLTGASLAVDIAAITTRMLQRRLPVRKDGWYAARPCPICRRPRAVVSVRLTRVTP